MTRVTPHRVWRKRSLLLWTSTIIDEEYIPPAKGPLAAVGKLVRWRSEIGATAVLSLTAYQITVWSDATIAALSFAGMVIASLGTPALRKRCVEYAVGLIVRHRFQGLCQQTLMRTKTGRLPLVLKTEVHDGSVYLLLGLRSGMSPELIEDYLPEIRTACLAEGVDLAPHPLKGPLVTLRVDQPWGL
ncbi:hypothetical protein ACIBH1_26325 [Nonomuraea sp. NPDC050663]|uniref:hypothetical protein n=1 Tax=Nonomuraea sp. NPDC050663 TaxID=3364370 RepID=UPI00378DFD0C